VSSDKEKPGRFFWQPGYLSVLRPVAFRPRLTTGVALS